MKKIVFICLTLFTSIYANDLKVEIDCYYTSWCPACKDTLSMIEEIDSVYGDKVLIKLYKVVVGSQTLDNKTISVLPFTKITLEEAKQHGVQESVPVVIVKDQKGEIVKKFYQKPQKRYFTTLIKRLYEGYLANGTLPIEQRVDLWTKTRN